jgi:outer membrane protein assembly factor BamB
MSFAWFFVALTLAAPPADWPQFRGPAGDGHGIGLKLPVQWSETEGIAWKTELPGRGWSSPVAKGKRIWLTTAEETAYSDDERQKKLAAAPQGESFRTHAEVTLLALEFDLESGKLLRKIELFSVREPEPIQATNSYATPTPVLAGDKLVCDFGSLGTCVLNTTSGEVVWRKAIKVDYVTGAGSSPIVCGERVILTRDGADEQFVAALNLAAGEELWRTARPSIDAKEPLMHRSFSTPLVITHLEREQLIVPGAQWLASYDPATGKEWWRVNFGSGFSTVPRPVFANGLVYFCTGFGPPQLWAVRVDGRGDVTESHVVWKHKRQVPEVSSPIVIGGELYFVSGKGVVTCLDAATGEQLWQERIGGNHSASPICADGKLYFLSSEGRTTVLNPGRKFEVLATNQLFGTFFASPVVAGNKLLLRSDSHLYAVER